MINFTGIQYVMIDIANQYGYDKRSWDYRIKWVKKYMAKLENFTNRADNKYLFIKAVKALRDAQAGIATGYIMGLDATASGLQCYAALVGCKLTAKAVNLIDSGRRADVYQDVSKEMDIDRDGIKDPLMTVFYGSTKQPEIAFGKGTKALDNFYNALNVKLPGAMDGLHIIQSCWNPDAYEYNWHLPDGHCVNMRVFQVVDKKIEVDELNHKTFTFRAMLNKPTRKGRSLAANVIHSVDAYIAREVVRRCYAEGVKVATIHDSFWTYPNDMNMVRRHYIAIMAEIADSDLLRDMLREITGETGLTITKDSDDLADDIRKCEYPLS